MTRRFVGIIAWCMMSVVFAQTPAQQSGRDIPLGLSQKQAFSRSLVEDASVSKRIQASQDEEAQRLMSLAGMSYNNGLAALASGDFSQAEKLFDASMSAIIKARRRVPDVAALAAKQRTEFQQLLERIAFMQQSFIAYSKRSNISSDLAINEMNERARQDVPKLTEQAKIHFSNGEMGDALRSAERAEQVIRLALGRVLGATIIEYPQKFATVTENYAFELDRNNTYLELIPVAINELKPTEDVKQTIESMVDQNRAALDLAREYEKLQDYAKALAQVRIASGYLKLALTNAGLVLSHSGGSE